LLRKLGAEKKVKEFEAIAKWPGIVGEQIAEVTEPERVVDGILFVKVKNSVWRNELIYMKRQILAKIAEAIKEKAIKDIRYF